MRMRVVPSDSDVLRCTVSGNCMLQAAVRTTALLQACAPVETLASYAQRSTTYRHITLQLICGMSMAPRSQFQYGGAAQSDRVLQL